MPIRASSVRFARGAAWIGAAVLVLGIWSSRAGRLDSRRPLPEGVKSPMLALQLLRSPDLLSTIIRTDEVAGGDLARRSHDDRRQLLYAVNVDFAFAMTYGAFLVLVGLFVIGSRHPRSAWTGAIVVVAALAAVYFDLRENVAIRGLLTGAPVVPRPWSLWKWAFAFVALGFSTLALLDPNAPPSRRVVGYLALVIGAFASIEGLTGVTAADDKLIETASVRAALAFVLAELFLATRQTLREGVLPALNRLADWPIFSWLVDWPSQDLNETVGDPVSGRSGLTSTDTHA